MSNGSEWMVKVRKSWLGWVAYDLERVGDFGGYTWSAWSPTQEGALRRARRFADKLDRKESYAVVRL